MRKISLVLFMTFFLAVFMSGILVAQPELKEYTGYLSDVLCASKGVAGDGANLATNPEKHTVACMKMPSCMESGFGILIQNSTGKYVFYKFDKAGSDLAIKLLKETKRTDNMKVKVTGAMEKDVIAVKSIVEVE